MRCFPTRHLIWSSQCLWEASTHLVCSVTQSSPILCGPVDCGPPGSSAHEILQARILEWVAMPPLGDLPMYDVKKKTFIFKFKKKEELGKSSVNKWPASHQHLGASWWGRRLWRPRLSALHTRSSTFHSCWKSGFLRVSESWDCLGKENRTSCSSKKNWSGNWNHRWSHPHPSLLAAGLRRSRTDTGNWTLVSGCCSPPWEQLDVYDLQRRGKHHFTSTHWTGFSRKFWS